MEACTGSLPNGRRIVGIKRNRFEGDPKTNCSLCKELVSVNDTVELFVVDDTGNIKSLFACCKGHKVYDEDDKIIKLEKLL
jgi:hypothetical protein